MRTPKISPEVVYGGTKRCISVSAYASFSANGMYTGSGDIRGNHRSETRGQRPKKMHGLRHSPGLSCATLLYCASSLRAFSQQQIVPARAGLASVNLSFAYMCACCRPDGRPCPEGKSRITTHGVTCCQHYSTRIAYRSGSRPSPPSIPCLKLIAASELFLPLSLLSMCDIPREHRPFKHWQVKQEAVVVSQREKPSSRKIVAIRPSLVLSERTDNV